MVIYQKIEEIQKQKMLKYLYSIVQFQIIKYLYSNSTIRDNTIFY